ncbi:metallophosphoesterase family protein [Marinococcus halotolerans]|uniref:metallophosphoesterase family protein n=1 Tax=Marinococcus halotolerans TaxID=301092 RepID=UPI0003B34118|nr:metallophosphoesterase family protein [Marinococcus halotolerans]
MQIALLSDVHGNARALKAVLNDLHALSVDHMYMLGDLAFRGPEPKNSIETVQSLPAKVLKGNADEWIVRGVREGEVPEAKRSIMNQERDWALERLSTNDVKYLEELPESFLDEYDGFRLFAFHAVPGSLFPPVPVDSEASVFEESFFQKQEADIYVYGHVHTPSIRKIGAKWVINTGSIGLPFDGEPTPSYVLLTIEDGEIIPEIRRVPYDTDEVLAQFDANDYPNSDQVKRIISSGRPPK